VDHWLDGRCDLRAVHADALIACEHWRQATDGEGEGEAVVQGRPLSTTGAPRRIRSGLRGRTTQSSLDPPRILPARLVLSPTADLPRGGSKLARANASAAPLPRLALILPGLWHAPSGQRPEESETRRPRRTSAGVAATFNPAS
jgi:hypothetical protein